MVIGLQCTFLFERVESNNINCSKYRYDWRQDATYPAAVVRVLNMHLHSIVDEIDGVNWSYHANDNAFLNYGDQWFSQRTLVARFMMNESVSRFGKKGDVVEVYLLSLSKCKSL